MPAPVSPLPDPILVAQCQGGNPAAWEQLRSRLLERASIVLRRPLAGRPVKKAAREERTADVLGALFLRKRLFESHVRSGGSLDGFLDYLLQRQAKHYYQGLAREKARRARLARTKSHLLEESALQPGIVEDLRKLLTPAERRYLEWRLQPEAEGVLSRPISASYARKLAQRIREKARKLSHGD